MRPFLRVRHDAEIHDIERIAVRIESRRNRSFQAMLAGFGSRRGFVTAIDGELVDQALKNIHSHNLRADRMQNLADRRRLVAKNGDERIAYIAKVIVARKIETIR